MPSKPIRVSFEVIEELNKLRPWTNKPNDFRPIPGYTPIIKKLLRDSSELRRIEQYALSEANVSKTIKNRSNRLKIVHSSKSEQIILYCFDCNEQTPHKKLKSPSTIGTDSHGNPIKRNLYKCLKCGSKRNV
jgi:hypothetical protein